MKPPFRDIENKLKYVRTSRTDYDLSLFPDFLIIGPQRTGTSWLHSHLERHPAVYMPPEKELYYFTYVQAPSGHPSFLPAVDPDLGWYLDQFRLRKEGQLHGEASAGYAAALNSPTIREIVTLNPDIKVLTMVRDPIERAWSHAKWDLSHLKDRAVSEIPYEDWITAFTSRYQLRCANYEQFHAVWRSEVPEENFFVGRFSDISNDPVGLMMSVFHFLGIEPNREFIADTEKRINPTAEDEIPPRLLKVLEALFGDESRRLKEAGLT